LDGSPGTDVAMLVRRPWSFSIEQKRFFSGEKRDHMEAVKKQQR